MELICQIKVKTWATVNSTVTGYYAGTVTIDPNSNTEANTTETTISGGSITANSIKSPGMSTIETDTSIVEAVNTYISGALKVNGSCSTSGCSNSGLAGTSGSSGCAGVRGKPETVSTNTSNFATTANYMYAPGASGSVFTSNGTTFTTQNLGTLTSTPGNIAGWSVNNTNYFMPNDNTPKHDDYTSAFQDMKLKIKEIMQKVPYIKNQVGAILFKENDILGIDIYDHPDSWEQIKQDIIAKEGSSFMNNPEDDDLFILNPKAFKKIVSKKLPDTFEEKTIYDKEYTVIELKSDNLMGEILIYKDQVLHLTIWNKNN